ncbi:oxidoreductase [Labrys wisconsinensis]|uniref:NAD(P)-dependent dehydrogenase (Short-subunit alcohol dehydrogenase family) n=1 Tax=Labrys wisconsinensis TaxID=425677 RepID=A0ABU0JIW5_9HYPH|nr:oxidoreductase [Labrys wisconsinensis]MDQ0474231.1 NAD(P)-dependent dehydrogenase (short-subunit alcohol dehydrogenase family) [Labrys wisconsinensis]
MNRTALVTGASSGIGEATAKALLADGYTVYAAARRLDRMAGLAAAGVRPIALDLIDDASMVAAVEKILGETGRIDVLVNNAGYGSYGALEDVPLEEARRQFEVNLFGAARLCQLVLPAMRTQKGGRIVNVSSIGGKGGEPFGAWYHATKFALEGLSDSLRMELIPFGIDVIVIEPGAIRTEWGGIAHESMLRMSGDTAYGPYARRHARLHERAGTRMASPPEVVARIIARAVASKRPRTRYPAGGGARWILLIQRFLTDRMQDRLMWRVSQGGA